MYIAITDLPWTIIYLIAITLFHPLLGLTAAIGAGLILALAWLSEAQLKSPTAAASTEQSNSRRKLAEIGRLSDIFRAHGQQDKSHKALAAIRQKSATTSIQVEIKSLNFKTTGKFVRQIIQLAMLSVGAWLVIKMQATGGVMIAGSILFGKMLSPLEIILAGWKQIQEARTSLENINKINNSVADESKHAPETTLAPPKGEVLLSDVSLKFTEKDATVLQGISFHLEAGSTLAVLGGSGSGKSSLARLLVGIHAPTSGEYRINGSLRTQYQEEALGDLTGYLPQEVLLHSGTIAQNIARLWHPTESLTSKQSEAIILAAKRAGAHDLIVSMAEGYDTLLEGETGSRILSGGQRQRIALARALYSPLGPTLPVLVVLDEPNSQLDAEGEAALERCIRALQNMGTTTVIVTHRPHVISLASHVLLLKSGQIENFGSRDQVRRWIAESNQANIKKQRIAA